MDGKILAFVGQNETGKTSLLNGLVWLSNGLEEPLPATSLNRSRPVAQNESAVRARFVLDAADKALLEDLDMASMPSEFAMSRRPNGSMGSDLHPPIQRNLAPFEDAQKRLTSARKRLGAQFDADQSEDEEEVDLVDTFQVVENALSQPDESWTDRDFAAFDTLSNWLEAVSPSSRSGRPRAAVAAQSLREAMRVSKTKHPRETGRERMLARAPRFVLFNDADRVLETNHDLSDDTIRNDPPPALRNLLRIADVNLDTLFGYVSTGDAGGRETYLDDANGNLLVFFSQAWNQSNVTVRLNVTGNMLEVMINELTSKGRITNIEERSDGLRTFIALSVFLAAQEFDVPPVLLIDEAETHLHYNAQADLVGVLLRSIPATQVLYTTHSPGCLPTDLGTSIRLVGRDPAYSDASILRADFWSNEEPGFAPILYAMGASAAAFSVCRKAVLAEGPADMILLPTLLRLATGVGDLDYQVAPGLANARGYGMNLEEIAARVVYLTDGDDGGAKHRKDLANSGVAPSRIFNLPKGFATEDLIPRATYVEVVNELMAKGSKKVAINDLAGDQPVAKELQDWGNLNTVKVPGKVAVAYALLRREDGLKLTKRATTALVKLHDDITLALR